MQGMAPLYRGCKEKENLFSPLNGSHARYKQPEGYCTKWDSQVTARIKNCLVSSNH